MINFQVGDIVVNCDLDVVYEQLEETDLAEMIIRGHIVAEVIEIHSGFWATIEVIGFIDQLNSKQVHDWIDEDHQILEINLNHCQRFDPTVNDPTLYERTLL